MEADVNYNKQRLRKVRYFREPLAMNQDINERTPVLAADVPRSDGSSRGNGERLLRHPGVGPVTALVFTLTIGPTQRFQRGIQIDSYLG
jgi:hypothetical protein